MLRTILSVSGKPGLYKLISQGKNMLILETLDATKKRFPAYGHDKVISLGDIAMYTDDEEVALAEVLESVKTKENGAVALLIIRRHHSQNSMLIWQKYFLHTTVTVYTLAISRS